MILKCWFSERRCPTIKRNDRRVKRTKKDLRNAFLTLALQKDIAQITVKDIIEEADYNRTTFYVHYADKFALMDDLMNTTIEGIINSIREPYRENKVIDLSTIQKNALLFVDYVYEHQQTFKILFNKEHFYFFEEKLTNSIMKVNLSDVTIEDETFQVMDKDILFRMHTKVLIGLLEFWTQSNFKYDCDYIKEQLINFWRIRTTLVQFR
ncbi:TetR family transcriptional regulator [Cytobacillus kochii]|uniref:TetR/AcrR family transcriptional regulator n=1 Tax=Cytobacillus kochii TaxID=859143 RepID=UPI001CD5BE13|nr:TetR family transcriptional regulator [Cytobacillus kochii]MCA1024478.1 TetR family transcriptional regulator [Cytobacillus kochii]